MSSIRQLIAKLEQDIANQGALKEQSDDICNIVKHEMDKVLESRSVLIYTSSKFHCKPWWNRSLTRIWKDMKRAERVSEGVRSDSSARKR